MDDAAIVEGLRLKRDNALVALVDKYQQKLFGYLTKMTGDPHLAEDLTQETLIKALRKADDIRDPSKLCSWLYRVAGNMARDHFASSRETPRPNIMSREVAAGPEESLERGLVQDTVRQALLSLKPEHREVLVLRYYQDLSLKQVSEVTGLAVGTVKSRLHYALLYISDYLEGEGR